MKDSRYADAVARDYGSGGAGVHGDHYHHCHNGGGGYSEPILYHLNDIVHSSPFTQIAWWSTVNFVNEGFLAA